MADPNRYKGMKSQQNVAKWKKSTTKEERRSALRNSIKSRGAKMTAKHNAAKKKTTSPLVRNKTVNTTGTSSAYSSSAAKEKGKYTGSVSTNPYKSVAKTGQTVVPKRNMSKLATRLVQKGKVSKKVGGAISSAQKIPSAISKQVKKNKKQESARRKKISTFFSNAVSSYKKRRKEIQEEQKKRYEKKK